MRNHNKKIKLQQIKGTKIDAKLLSQRSVDLTQISTSENNGKKNLLEFTTAVLGNQIKNLDKALALDEKVEKQKKTKILIKGQIPPLN